MIEDLKIESSKGQSQDGGTDKQTTCLIEKEPADDLDRESKAPYEHHLVDNKTDTRSTKASTIKKVTKIAKEKPQYQKSPIDNVD